MSLPNNLTSLLEMMSKLPQQKIAKAISVILLGYIAYQGAQLTWLLLEEPTANIGNVTTTGEHNQQQQQELNLSALKALNLFGKYNEKPVEKSIEVQDAPETRLNLTLSGVVASDDANISAAVIENGGKQETYGIGDTITGTRASLEKVFNDRVLIKQSGRLETLMLDGFKYEKITAKPSRDSRPKSPTKVSEPPRARKNLVDQRENKVLTDNVTQLKNDINEDPAKITDYLKISPKRENGSIVGYRLMPGKKAEFFESAGLKSGDVAIQMNGLDLTNPSEAAQALKALREEQEVSLLLDRDGDMTEILFSINE